MFVDETFLRDAMSKPFLRDAMLVEETFSRRTLLIEEAVFTRFIVGGRNLFDMFIFTLVYPDRVRVPGPIIFVPSDWPFH